MNTTKGVSQRSHALISEKKRPCPRKSGGKRKKEKTNYLDRNFNIVTTVARKASEGGWIKNKRGEVCTRTRGTKWGGGNSG